ncbi:MAG TPA: hypothetical protein VI362_05085 [Ignavibacteriaceae bacterium]|nr:hypothetical protein [Ignavibacteriaceae bacterium]
MNASKLFLIESVSLLQIILLVTFCSTSQTNVSEESTLKKISFDIGMLNAEGLYGEPEGLVSLDYKFCIPMNDDYKTEVAKLDTTINFHDGTGIKDGCSKNEYLCIGNTHQKDFKKVVIRLASLNYVQRIDQMFWEK